MSTDTKPDVPGPTLLEERSILGILIHPLIAFPGGIFLALLLYRFSNHPFTVENSRNALNWNLSFLGLFFLLLALTFLVWEFFLLPTFIVGFVGVTCSFCFCIVATAKAIFGTAWEYPLAPEVL